MYKLLHEIKGKGKYGAGRTGQGYVTYPNQLRLVLRFSLFLYSILISFIQLCVRQQNLKNIQFLLKYQQVCSFTYNTWDRKIATVGLDKPHYIFLLFTNNLFYCSLKIRTSTEVTDYDFIQSVHIVGIQLIREHKYDDNTVEFRGDSLLFGHQMIGETYYKHYSRASTQAVSLGHNHYRTVSITQLPSIETSLIRPALSSLEAIQFGRANITRRH